MARKYYKYPYTPSNPEKFTGDTIPVILRSSWELEFAQHCDLLPTVLSWSYETVAIPYRDPLTGKQKTYTPDFFVEIAQRDGYSQQYVFEIKPMQEQLQEFARSRADSALVARNNAKWAAATMWADRHSSEFVILNEKDLYAWHDAKKPRINPIKTYSQTHSNAPNPKKPRTATKAKKTSKRSAAISRMRSRVGKSRIVPSSAKAGKARRA